MRTVEVHGVIDSLPINKNYVRRQFHFSTIYSPHRKTQEQIGALKRLSGTMNAMNSPYLRQPRRGTPASRPSQASGRHPFRRNLPVWLLVLSLIGIFSLALLPFILFGGVYTYYLLSGRIFPGVTVDSISAQNQTRAEFAQTLTNQWDRQKMLVATDGKQSWAVAPGTVGLQIDTLATAERAFQVGRDAKGLQELFWMLRFGGQPVDPVIHFDPAGAQKGLQQLAAQIDQPAQNAALAFSDGEWIAKPGKNGSVVNMQLTFTRLAAQPEAVLSSGFLPIYRQTVIPRVADLSPVLKQLKQTVEHPLRMQAYDPITNQMINIPVSSEEFAGWVTVNPQGDAYTLELDALRVSQYLEAWKTSLAPDRTLAAFSLPADLNERWQNGQTLTFSVSHNPTNYVVQPGDTLTRIAYTVGMPYWKIAQANPDIQPDQLRAGQNLVIPSKNEMLPLPVILNKRIVISISQQHMWVYENNALRNEYVISTGIDRSPTIPGVYQVQTHEINAYASVWDLYMPHFMGIYEGWPGFMNGIHGLPVLSGGRRLWAGALGHPVSYGCIILGLQEAEDLYNWAEAGTVVEIQP